MIFPTGIKMGGKKFDLPLRRTSNLMTDKVHTAPVRLWKRLQINEWTFIFSLFILSLSIFLGKLYINYGSILQLQNNVKYVTSSTSVFSNMSNIFDLSYISGMSEFNVKQLAAVNEKFINSSQYDDVVIVMTSFCKSYGWLIRAAICGLIMMGFTWFIIYNDSSIPGINPPSPFSASKQRLPKVYGRNCTSGVQINYLIGILNGILIFVYMCL